MALDPFRPLTNRQRQESERRTPLSQPQSIPVTNVKTSNTTLYTAKSDKFFHIERMAAANVGTGNLTLDVWLVPSGGSADDSNVTYDGYTINAAAVERLTALEGTLIEPGTSIVVVTNDATNGANFWLWGVDVQGGSISV